jgi:hypothetical protein
LELSQVQLCPRLILRVFLGICITDIWNGSDKYQAFD